MALLDRIIPPWLLVALLVMNIAAWLCVAAVTHALHTERSRDRDRTRQIADDIFNSVIKEAMRR